MKIKDLAVRLCTLEKGKRQVDISQMQEVLANLSDLIVRDGGIDIYLELKKNGESRKIKKKA